MKKFFYPVLIITMSLFVYSCKHSESPNVPTIEKTPTTTPSTPTPTTTPSTPTPITPVTLNTLCSDNNLGNGRYTCPDDWNSKLSCVRSYEEVPDNAIQRCNSYSTGLNGSEKVYVIDKEQGLAYDCLTALLYKCQL